MGDELRIVRLLRALESDCKNTDGWQDAAPTIAEAANIIEKLGETLRSARGIVVEDANACRAFRDESEGPSGPENVLVKIDAALRLLRGEEARGLSDGLEGVGE